LFFSSIELKCVLSKRTPCRKKGTGILHHQPGTKEDAIARSQSALKNIVNAFRFVLL
jgi:hypothetical protein